MNSDDEKAPKIAGEGFVATLRRRRRSCGSISELSAATGLNSADSTALVLISRICVVSNGT